MGLVLFAVLSPSCVCLQPVDETPPLDGGLDAGVELTVTSFIVPVPVEDLSCLFKVFWPTPAHAAPALFNSLGGIHELDSGVLLVDSIAGIVLPGGEYLPPSSAYRAEESTCVRNGSSWFRWQGSWHRLLARQTIDVASPSASASFWALDESSLQMAATGGFSSTVLDAGDPLNNSIEFSARASRDETRLVVSNGITVNPGSRTETHLFVPPGDFDAPPILDRWVGLMTDATELGTWSWATWGGEIITPRDGGFDSVFPSTSAFCGVPLISQTENFDFACWKRIPQNPNPFVTVVGGTATAINTTTIEVPGLWPNQIIETNPLRYFALEATDAGTVVLDICTTTGCELLQELSSYPPNTGLYEGTVLVADYVADAGLRITRYPPGHW